jgi:hypothetical protein
LFNFRYSNPPLVQKAAVAIRCQQRGPSGEAVEMAKEGKTAVKGRSRQKKRSRIAPDASEKMAPLSQHPVNNDSANMARSFSLTLGKRGGSTKDPFKGQVIAEGAKVGISRRTVERALSKNNKI